MRKSLLALTVGSACISLLALATGCSDLTHPDEIRIIAEPAQQAPVADKAKAAAPKPGGAIDANGGDANGGDAKGPKKLPVQAKPQPNAGQPASCGG